MKLIVILGLFAAVSANPLDGDWGAVKTFQDNPRISATEELRNEASARIVNGSDAAPMQFPYQAGLIVYKKGGRAVCGGSIISNRWVLTAGHCIYRISIGVDVYLGAWELLNRNESNKNLIFVSRKNVILHENFGFFRLLNDISLIKLPVLIQFNDYIQPINLPKKSVTYSTFVGEWAIASGWGGQGAEKNNSYILQWAQLPVITNEECSKHFEPWRDVLSMTRLCTRGEGTTSICHGDSGGPLVLADESRMLIGISSFGNPSTCEAGTPNVFVRVTSYLDWIAEKTGMVLN